ncbi:tRNA glutamyl-Q(34) synthetase GluQRS [Nitrosomonas mobilis]|uniref:Glutamyl-Q tRNA(Asp) synthetase n=1 Tax=Nitrosomonas mobilis TaxID=51642 RepID=A0A1G5SG55_9PROT|nr:tRNA glutamyl-Q(34) synthetase GluQRS [Nitrosomonas mobilis]SCZ86108.1 Glutamyl-Q tRNA(Asp) synthetase [Nitrosomonas mobilis]HNO75412.1 tRNA glutamyl-Q(34) synthetase GluQRS [Nitrosomonas mobilis]
MSRNNAYRGRFAPSPTGPLHFGSLVTAVGSYLEAKSHQGKWLVRIEDVDTPRVIKGAADDILRTLEAFGLYWDETVVYQSKRTAAYQETLDNLQQKDWLYPCTCSRQQIAAHGRPGQDGFIYPGTCRQTGINETDTSNHCFAWRIHTREQIIQFHDLLRGQLQLDLPNELGDFVLCRSDGIFTYQLAVAVDDAWQRVTHVVRGTDLLFSTFRQRYLQQLLGYVTPTYCHLPLALDSQGKKLSKRTHAFPVSAADPLPTLLAALAFLGQDVSNAPRDNIETFWQWARLHWQWDKIPLV